VVKDLFAARLESGLPTMFETPVESIDPERGIVRHAGGELECEFVAGCDGFHGVSRPSIPAGVLRTFARDYPYGWLGIIAAVAPSHDELIYSHTERGFALLSMRSPELSRLYLQCAPDEDLELGSDERIWKELQERLGVEGWTLHEGPILEQGVTGMRSYVCEPMRCGRLFLAGDAAHIVPPTGAKGLNLAASDVRYLSRAFIEFYHERSSAGIDAYSDTCLRRVWKAERFSWWFTSLMHRFPETGEFGQKLQEAEIGYLLGSTAASTALAENYVGLPLER
jgi:p-hydroxybenzoate 3-monooxygenase